MVSFVGIKAVGGSDVDRSEADKNATTSMEEDADTEMRLVNEDEDDDDQHICDDEHQQQPQQQQQQQHQTSIGQPLKKQHRRTTNRQQSPGTEASQLSPFVSPKNPVAATTSVSPECDLDEPDEEQLKRILSGKRLSEGNCNRHLANHLNSICRKNSLHMIGESLPPVTEGEPMRHMSHHMSQNIDGSSSHSNSTSSSSLRGGGNVRHLASNKRNSQDENTVSCSSSTSLDGSSGALRSPTRRRSSTVSQCSSVLSEGTRQQLNFDLSPDLAPDSSILEANAISPNEFERPASPEPSSLDSMGDYDGSSSFELRPVSRMSDCAQFNCSNSDEPSMVAMTMTELDDSHGSPDLAAEKIERDKVDLWTAAAQQHHSCKIPVEAVETRSEMTSEKSEQTSGENILRGCGVTAGIPRTRHNQCERS